ncbi:putative xenobiotic-transporting ATPase [Medicago truncatula]|uniref:ABC-type xenobiotic transporter n=1 Tax=Medicago truncatula TaxID=3880 RepID=A0A072THH3_MEDTR|nr:ABC transporter C family member 10 [Medicago truncatula]KEH16403.1 multidrug resistance-associated protein ABC domain protein [Medicago truncatula]RHN51670.1 putative xenobiotic-transporting ATPase [Medicago truncatula]
MVDVWSFICGDCGFSKNGGKPFCYDINFLKDPSSCINHLMVTFLDVFLLIMLLFMMFLKISSRPFWSLVRYSNLQLVSAITNGFLGLLQISLGIWILKEKLRKNHEFFPLKEWLLEIFHGFTWLSVSLTVSLQLKQPSRACLWICFVPMFFVCGTLCTLSMSYAIGAGKLSLKAALNVLSFPGAVLLLLGTYKACQCEDANREIGESLYAPLNCHFNEVDPISNVTPFCKAGFFSKISFWWLNPLMKTSQEKTLQDEDIPKLREFDRAETCYLTFVEQLNKQRQCESSKHSSILWTIILCHQREILVTGLFAFFKVLALSFTPLLLNAFIMVAEGNESFKYEGYILAMSLFFIKIIESLSQRQWYFRTRLVGMKVRSQLTATISKKILRLSNTARLVHSGGEIMNYMTVDAYRIGEFPFWFHQTWTTILQLCIALVILFRTIGLATLASMAVIVLTVLCNAPLSKLQYKFQSKLMLAQDERLKVSSEALTNMKVLKLYAWENHFKNVVDCLRNVELKLLSSVQLRRTYNVFLFWASPILVSVASFLACYFLEVPLHASNVFTFVATLNLVQDPISSIPDVITAIIQAKVAFARIAVFLNAPELLSKNLKNECFRVDLKGSISIKSADFSWEGNALKPTLRSINFEVRHGQKVAICGKVGSGKSTLLATILGEVPKTKGIIDVHGKFAYVSQTAWIQTGTIRENILFGSEMDDEKYLETLKRSSLLKDLELFCYGDLTEIGERGVNLSGGQKQRIQLARAFYENADIYLLDDPFSAVDAHTAKKLFDEYIIEGLKGKTVLLVTHQVELLPKFDSILLISDGVILQTGPYHQLMTSSQDFQDLINAHKETSDSDQLASVTLSQRHSSSNKCTQAIVLKQFNAPNGNQLIKKEERGKGDTGLKPYLQYLNQMKGYIFFSMTALTDLLFVVFSILQNSWMAANVDNPHVSALKLILVYFTIGAFSIVFIFTRGLLVVALGLQSSNYLFSQLMNSLFRAPMSFYDSTPLGRILSRVSSDLSIIDLDIPFSLTFAVGAPIVFFSSLTVLAVVSWQVLIVAIPMIYVAILMQKYYFALAKEVMRINGTTKSSLANHVAETVAGAATIRAFEDEDRSFEKNLYLIDVNASSFFHIIASNEWLIQRLEIISAIVLTAAALCMVMLPPGTFTSGFIGMALSYGLSLNAALVYSIQHQCTLANYIISVERLNQYMHIKSEAEEIVEENRPPLNWPVAGKVEINDLKIRYRPEGPLVLHGITCTFEPGRKIGIVGRTGCGKSTLISALFRLVEPAGGKIIIDGIDITSIGLHDLRSRLGIIPQDPILFTGTVRYNLDPLSEHTDQEIWEVLGKCQLREVVQGKEEGLNSSVLEDGSNWSMGQRQLFCLGRALLRRSRILVLDEATASIDNSTDLILQKNIRVEFADCTVITVAHRIPTVMDCNMVLAISDGELAEYDEPTNLMKREESLFRKLVIEYWSHFQSAESH